MIPNGDRVLIELVTENKEVQKTGSGLYIPDQVSAQQPYEKGTVIEVGEGVKTNEGKIVSVSFKKGDFVALPKSRGAFLRMNNKEYILIREEEIMLTLESLDDLI